MILFGADQIQDFPQAFPGRVALLTGPSGRTASGRSTAEILAQHCNLCLLLAPEHGVRGDLPAGALVSDSTDSRTGLPVVSLYSENSRRLSQETLDRFDTLVYDIADVGCRYYTFISSLLYCMEDCARSGKHLTVLDRPNPLGDRVEGSLLQEDMTSFVGCYPLPVCYGLTCGELAGMLNAEKQIGCDLTVIPCRGLTQDMDFPRWQLPWIMPSPNMPRYETALLYPGTCLIEGTNFSEGRGTADPFAIIGAPWVDAEDLTEAFLALQNPGVTASPVYFTPSASKHQGQICGGIHLHVMDPAALEPVHLGIRLLNLLKTRYPDDFQILPGIHQGGRPFLSLLAGHREFENPQWDPETLIRQSRQDAALFRRKKQPYELYRRNPHVHCGN